MRINCIVCNSEFYVKPSHYQKRGTRCCSRLCRDQNKKLGEFKNCTNCGVEVYKSLSDIKKNSSGEYFCTKSCKTSHRNRKRVGELHPNYTNGKASYRRLAISKYGYICSNGESCLTKGISLPEVLYEVDHIDSNRSNNSLENLQVLCIACHRMKTLNKNLKMLVKV